MGGKEMEAVKLVVWDANFGKSDEYLGEVVCFFVVVVVMNQLS